MKKILKNRIFIFALGILISSSISVLAQTYFPSNDVTYDNTQSGLSSNNVQEAIDELYEECTKVPAPGDTILDSVDVVTSGDGLYEDTYEKGRYFYKGKNVNNYIIFNNEVWRIISIESDKTIKIMRDASIGNRKWDDPTLNNWTRPASLNTYLNGSYLTGTLNSTAQSQIVAKDWSIGEVAINDTSLSSSIEDENSSKWNGKVALITSSEYIRSNSNQSSCGNMNQLWNSTTCNNTTWMYNSSISNWWTLSPNAGYSGTVFSVGSSGNFGYSFTNTTDRPVRPAVYLSSSVQIIGGNGSSETPYQIK